MAKYKSASITGETKKQIMASVSAILGVGDAKIITDFLEVIHSFLEQIAIERMLLKETEEERMSGLRAGIKLALIQKDMAKESDNLLSDEFLKFLDQGHGDTGDHRI